MRYTGLLFVLDFGNRPVYQGRTKYFDQPGLLFFVVAHLPLGQFHSIRALHNVDFIFKGKKKKKKNEKGFEALPQRQKDGGGVGGLGPILLLWQASPSACWQW